MKHKLHAFSFVLLFSGLIQASQLRPSLSCHDSMDNQAAKFTVELYGNNAYLTYDGQSHSLRSYKINEKILSYDLKYQGKDFLVWIDEESEQQEITLIVMSDSPKKQSQEEYYFLSCDS